MYKPHGDFVPPPPDAALWRYMDFTKFVSLLDKKALFFPRSDKLGDPFEGSFPITNVQMRPVWYKEHAEKINQQLPTFIKESRRFTLISCWHESEYESEAMWQRYSREKDGIAIRTTFSAFAESLIGPEDIFIGRVTYLDYAQDVMPENNVFFPYLHKRRSFEHEREVRAIIQTIPSSDGPSGEPRVDMSQDLYDVGLYVQVDLSSLLHQVLVAPLAPDWFLELTTSISTLYGLRSPVSRSALSGDPVWG